MIELNNPNNWTSGYDAGYEEALEEVRARVEFRMRNRGQGKRRLGHGRRWWGAFYHGLDCALSDIDAVELRRKLAA